MDWDKFNVIDTHAIRKMGFPNYVQTVDGFASALDANEIYNTDRPVFVPGGDHFREHLATMKKLGAGADRGDSLMKEQRQTERQLTDMKLDASFCYLKIIAIHRREPSLLYTFGLPIKDLPRSTNGRRHLLPEAIPIEAEAKHLKGESGGIVLECIHIRNGGPYLVNLCQRKPESEENWYNPGGHYNSCREIVLRGLQRACEYYIRVRTDGPNGPGPWSNVVSIVVL